MDLLALVARLTLDKSQYEQGLGDASSEAKSFGDKLKSGLGSAAKIGATAIAAVGTAAVAVTATLIKQTGEVAAYGDNIDKASQKLGISAEAYQEWDAVLQHSGTSIDSMSIGMKTLATQAAKGSDSFTALGISQEKAASMSREDLFAETITALQNVTDENKRAQLAQELFGRSAMELGPLLNTSAEETQAMRDRVHELGGVMSDEAVKAAAKYQNTLQDMQTAFNGAKRSFVSEFVPSLTAVMEGITDIFTGNGIGKINEGISQFVAKLNDVMPRILDTGSQIVLTLATAIINNLPSLVSAATSTIITLVNGIVQQLPNIGKVAIQIISTLVSGIGQALPQLIPAAANAVMGFAQALYNNIPKLIASGGELLKGVITGIINAVPVLVNNLPKVIQAITSYFTSSVGIIAKTGQDLLDSLIDNLPTVINTIVSALPKIISSMVNFFTSSIPQIVKSGVELLSSLIKNLPQIISNILAAIPKIITGVVGAFAQSIPQIARAGVELFVSLIKDLPRIIVDIVKAVPQIIAGIVRGFAGGIGDMVNVGGELLKGVWQGLSNAGDWLWGKVKGLFSSLTDRIKNFFGIHSPSTVFAEIGKRLDEGLGRGIVDNASAALNPLLDLAGDMSNVDFEATGTFKGYKAGAGLGNIYNFNITQLPGEDAEALARRIQQIFVRWENQREAAYV